MNYFGHKKIIIIYSYMCVCVHVCENYYNYYFFVMFFFGGGCFCYLCFILFVCLFVWFFFLTFIYVKCADNVYCLTPHYTVFYDKETILIY